MTRGTRASNPPGTCISRAVQRAARDDAYRIVILDLTGLSRRPACSALRVFFLSLDKFGYSNTRTPGQAVTCVLQKNKRRMARGDPPSGLPSSIDRSLYVYLRDRPPSTASLRFAFHGQSRWLFFFPALDATDT